MTLIDHHDWVHNAAVALRQTDIFLWTAMSKEWVKSCADRVQMQAIVDSIEACLR
jgi:hypothetical protein